MIVEILSGPITNWEGFNHIIQESFGKNPTRCLDENDLKLDNPYSFLVSLQHLMTGNTEPDIELFNFLSFTFGIHCDNITADQLGFCESYTKKIRIEVDRYTSVVVLTSSLLDWKHVIPFCLSSNLPEKIRLAYSKIFLIFRQTDLRNLWSNYEVSQNQDNIITLKVKI